MKKIKKALQYVITKHPEVIGVEFDRSGAWSYFDKDRNYPTFDDSINVDILEEASEEADWPSTHYV